MKAGEAGPALIIEEMPVSVTRRKERGGCLDYSCIP